MAALVKAQLGPGDRVTVMATPADSRGMETAMAAALFGAVGLTVDRLLNDSRTVYRAPAPARAGSRVSVSRGQIGAQFGLRF